MPIRRVALALVFLAVPASAHADRHFADLMAGYFKAKGSDYDGIQLSGSWPLLPCIDVSLVGSFGSYGGVESDDPAHHRLQTFVIGGRWTQHWSPGGHQLLPFGQILIGNVYNTRFPEGGPIDVATHNVIVFGAGLQPRLRYNTGFKLLARVQVDVFARSREDLGGLSPGGWGYALSAGLMYQFGPEFDCKKCDKKKGPCDPQVPAPPSPPKPSTRYLLPETTPSILP